MRVSGILKGLKLLAVFACILTLCATVLAEENNENLRKKEISSSLEERMQKKISVDFRDTPIDDVIRVMADQAGVDILKSPKVTGNVTATLTNVPLEEALSNILAAHGYNYVAGKNMIRIVPASEVVEGSEVLVSRIYRITYADVKQVEDALKKFISKRGSMSSSSGSSNIIVTDTESKIKAVDDFIGEIDRMTPQILVEARIYDITSTNNLDLGVEWNIGTQTTYHTDTTAVVAPGTMGNSKTGNTNPFTTGMFRGATGKTSSTTGLLKFGWFTDNVDIDAIIRAQKNLIDAKLLANPRVLVLDNEKANIKIISELPYQEITETSAGGSIGATKFRDVGVELEVTPHLTRGDMIRLHLKPKFSVNTGEVSVVGASDNQFPVPIVDRREADTTLLIKDGQTIVLGGLRKKVASHRVNKVPFLGDIPVLGALFRFEGESTVNSELVVFITPTIVMQPAMSVDEQLKFDVTEFPTPTPEPTMAEKSAE